MNYLFFAVFNNLSPESLTHINVIKTAKYSRKSRLKALTDTSRSPKILHGKLQTERHNTAGDRTTKTPNLHTWSLI